MRKDHAAHHDVRQRRLRKMLLGKQRELASAIEQERRSLKEGSVELASDSLGGIADRPVLTSDAGIGYEVVDHRAQLLTQVALALKKLDEGTYGQCEACDESIPSPRLKALPFAIRCTRCQETVERGTRRTLDRPIKQAGRF